MKTLKKALGIVLTIAILANVFAMGAIAAFPEDTAVKLMISTDKATYAPGDIVTITFSEQVISEVGDMRIGGQYEIAYPSSVIEPVASTGALADHGFTAIQAGVDTSMSEVYFDQNAPSANSYNWDKTIAFGLGDDLATSFAATEGIDLFTVTMKISENAAYGTYTIGYNPEAYEQYSAYSNDANNGGLYGPSASDYGFSVPNMYEYGTCEITVGAAEEPFPSPSIVNPLKGQIRFNKDADGNFASFDVRAMAVISKADFESKFAEGEAAEAPGVIKDIGFVFAAASNDVDLTYGNVKKVVEGGETVEGYAKKEVKFISTSIDSPNYVFTCVVTGMTAEDYEDSLLAVAYIAYADADGNAVYCYYPAVQEVSYSGLIDEYYDDIFGEAFTK